MVTTQNRSLSIDPAENQFGKSAESGVFGMVDLGISDFFNSLLAVRNNPGRRYCLLDLLIHAVVYSEPLDGTLG